jgi:tetratricopeptide (TPR) repeat protein
MVRVLPIKEALTLACLVSVLVLTACSGSQPALNSDQVAASRSEMQNLITNGDGQFAASKYEDAAGLYKKAMENYPEQPVPRFAYGHTLFALGEYDRATDSILKGLELMPKWSRSEIDLQAFFQYPLEFQDKLQRLENWVNEHPDDRKATFLLAYCKHFSAHKIEARHLFKKLIYAEDKTNEASRMFLPPAELPRK